jgi:hypothetical protein
MTFEPSAFALEIFAKDGIENVERFVYELIEAEAKRRWHIQRSAPKMKDAALPVGRPAVGVKTKRVRELGEALRAIYLRLKELYAEEYTALFAPQEEAMEAAVLTEDLDTLTRIMREQPWNKRGTNV